MGSQRTLGLHDWNYLLAFCSECTRGKRIVYQIVLFVLVNFQQSYSAGRTCVLLCSQLCLVVCFAQCSFSLQCISSPWLRLSDLSVSLTHVAQKSFYASFFRMPSPAFLHAHICHTASTYWVSILALDVNHS